MSGRRSTGRSIGAVDRAAVTLRIEFANLGGWAGWGPTFSVQKVVKGASKLKFGGQGFVSGIQVVVLSKKVMVWGSKIIYFGLLRFLYEYFSKTVRKRW